MKRSHLLVAVLLASLLLGAGYWRWQKRQVTIRAERAFLAQQTLLVERTRLEEKLRRLRAEAPTPEPPKPGVALGPNTGDAPVARRDAVLALLAGRKPAADLPVEASSPDEPFIYHLRDALAPFPDEMVLVGDTY